MNAISEPRACVAGWPVAHSRSPMIHNFWLRTYGIEGVYDRVAVPIGGFAEFAATIGKGELRGANVTVPHKQAALPACDRLTSAAQEVGAVNTLWRDAGLLCGDNTDVGGFLACLDEEAPNWRAQVASALVLGAGGAARAVVYALLSAGVANVAVANRTMERASALSETLGPRVWVVPWDELAKWMKKSDLFVNATSLGMIGQSELDVDLANLPPSAIVADIVYVPLMTRLLDQAARRGHRTVGGLGMLLHQAAPGFERWFGTRPVVSRELRALVEADILSPPKSPS